MRIGIEKHGMDGQLVRVRNREGRMTACLYVMTSGNIHSDSWFKDGGTFAGGKGSEVLRSRLEAYCPSAEILAALDKIAIILERLVVAQERREERNANQGN